ncbi:MAG: Nif3-like dinuclear metal center hexameric protein [Janthinobacterium lividum]
MKNIFDQSYFKNKISRRKLIIDSSKILAATAFFSSPLTSFAASFLNRFEQVTVGQIMDAFIKQVPGGEKSTTVDTLKAGNREIVVTGVVTTMFATIDVIRKSIALGANFIIAHEPTFYNHADDTKWLESNDVYQYKMNLLKQHNIAVWRNHDYIHSAVPDGVLVGVVEQLGWQKYEDKTVPYLFNFEPAPKLDGLINELKTKMGIKMVRYIGDLNQPCKKVLFMEGSAGGKTQISGTSLIKPDVLICGEISEWETAEYVRDARAKGDPLSLIVLGHIASEEPGSDYLLKWMKTNFPAIKTTHLAAGNSLSFR